VLAQAGVDRLAVTGRARASTAPTSCSATFYRSTIRSDERLDYDRVDRIFAGRAVGGALGGAARVARGGRAGARRAAAQKGALAIESAESSFAFDARATSRGPAPRCRPRATVLIEHLMIAANEQVATLLSQRKVGTLYRVHERPDPARVEHLAAQLASLEVPAPPCRRT
jgi:ribonuclease R